MEDAIFCPVCNFATTKIEREYMIIDLECPSCHSSNLSNFYSYGSTTHRINREDYEAGVYFKHQPLPFYSETLELYNVVEVFYFDENNADVKHSVEVYRHGYKAGVDAISKATVTLFGCTSEKRAISHGKHFLLANMEKYQKQNNTES
jgi:Zn-finger nucleic acid-binding protein